MRPAQPDLDEARFRATKPHALGIGSRRRQVSGEECVHAIDQGTDVVDSPRIDQDERSVGVGLNGGQCQKEAWASVPDIGYVARDLWIDIPVSYRNLEAMMTERGVAVDHSTLYRWVQRFSPGDGETLAPAPVVELAC